MEMHRKPAPDPDFPDSLLNPWNWWVAAAQEVATSTDDFVTALKAQRIYAQAQHNELIGLERKNPAYDFADVKAENPGAYVTTSTIDGFPFCKVWNFTKPRSLHDPDFLLIAPYSGRDARIMSGYASALLPFGNVRLIGQGSVHLVPSRFTNGADDIVEAARRVATPRDHVIAVSQGGSTAIPVAALANVNSLTIVGSPYDARRDPTGLNKMARSHDPYFVNVGVMYPGFGASYVPGNLTRICLGAHSAKEMVGGAEDQDLPREHIRDTLQRVFRDFLLAKNEYRHRGAHVDIRDGIKCPVLTVAGDRDDVVSMAQTHALKDDVRNGRSLTLLGADHYDLVQPDIVKRIIVPEIIKMVRHQQSQTAQMAFA